MRTIVAEGRARGGGARDPVPCGREIPYAGDGRRAEGRASAARCADRDAGFPEVDLDAPVPVRPVDAGPRLAQPGERRRCRVPV